MGGAALLKRTHLGLHHPLERLSAIGGCQLRRARWREHQHQVSPGQPRATFREAARCRFAPTGLVRVRRAGDHRRDQAEHGSCSCAGSGEGVGRARGLHGGLGIVQPDSGFHRLRERVGQRRVQPPLCAPKRQNPMPLKAWGCRCVRTLTGLLRPSPAKDERRSGRVGVGDRAWGSGLFGLQGDLALGHLTVAESHDELIARRGELCAHDVGHEGAWVELVQLERVCG